MEPLEVDILAVADTHIVEILLQSGFSVGVAAFLLLRMERELKNLTAAIERLRLCQVCKLRPENDA